MIYNVVDDDAADVDEVTDNVDWGTAQHDVDSVSAPIMHPLSLCCCLSYADALDIVNPSWIADVMMMLRLHAFLMMQLNSHTELYTHSYKCICKTTRTH